MAGWMCVRTTQKYICNPWYDLCVLTLRFMHLTKPQPVLSQGPSHIEHLHYVQHGLLRTRSMWKRGTLGAHHVCLSPDWAHKFSRVDLLMASNAEHCLRDLHPVATTLQQTPHGLSNRHTTTSTTRVPHLKLHGYSVMRVVGNSKAIEQQQLEVWQRPI